MRVAGYPTTTGQRGCVLACWPTHPPPQDRGLLSRARKESGGCQREVVLSANCSHYRDALPLMKTGCRLSGLCSPVSLQSLQAQQKATVERQQEDLGSQYCRRAELAEGQLQVGRSQQPVQSCRRYQAGFQETAGWAEDSTSYAQSAPSSFACPVQCP